METPTNPVPALLAKKRVLKTKITKAKNVFVTMMNSESDYDYLTEDFKEFNDNHKQLKAVFEKLYETVSEEEVDKFVNEEQEIKQIYRDTKRTVENYLKCLQLNASFSTVFTQDTNDDVIPTKASASLAQQTPFKGFNDADNVEVSMQMAQQSSDDSTEFQSVQESSHIRHTRSSTPNAPLVEKKSLPLTRESSYSTLNFDHLAERFTKIKSIGNQKVPSERKTSDMHNKFQIQKSNVDDVKLKSDQQLQQQQQAEQSKSIDDERQRLERDRLALEREKVLFESTKRDIELQQLRATMPSHTPLKLGPVTLKEFDGSFDQWLSFRDRFKRYIHESNRPIIEKFQRLCDLLVGNASTFVKNVQMSEDNYEAVWKDIQEHFDNPRRILSSHVQAILDLEKAKPSNSIELRTTLDKFKAHMRALKTAEYDTNAEIFHLHILLSKLDTVTLSEWEKDLVGSKQVPTLESLYKKIEECIAMLEIKQEVAQVPVQLTRKMSKPESFRKNSSITPRKSSLHVTSKHIKCYICQKDHMVFKCPDVLQATPQHRLEMIQAKKLCLNCFSINHAVIECKSGTCRATNCNQKHHTLLHDAMKENVKSLISTALMSRCNETILATALVIIYVDGKPHTARMLLDGGSQCNFITEACCQRLKLSTQSENMDISGIGKTSHTVNRSVNITLNSIACDYAIDIPCLVMKNITEKIPQNSFSIRDWQIPHGVKLADPEFNKSANVDILVSSSVFFGALTNGIIQIGKNKPRLFKSHFGWLVAGGELYDNSEVNPCPISYHVISKQSLAQQIEKFWLIESVPEEKMKSIEDEICESHFVNTSRRIDSKIVVNLPFRSDPSQLRDNNRSRAEACWFATERKFDKDERLQALYNDFMTTYVDLGHMKEASDDIRYYIPHHHVFKPGANEKKFRVVFNASSKTRDNISLNDLLYVGPSIQDDLFDIMLRFREHPIAISGDIEKMYRQVMMNEKDQQYQGIVWREDKSQPLKSYKLCTVTYGTGPGAFLATRAIQEAVELDGSKYPEAAKVIVRDFYMDDLLTSCGTVKEAIEIREQVQDLLDRSGLPMRKWISNNDVVLKSIPEDFRGMNDLVNMQKDETIKTLGIHWSPKEDVFIYSSTKFHDDNTKRHVFSDISKLFDPIGLLGPFVMKAKSFMQSLWKHNLSWDEKLPKNLDDVWEQFKSSMSCLNEIKIERVLIPISKPKRLLLFGFSDASECGYGACVYLVTESQEGNVTSKLVASKSRVAPINTLSIPRLELCGAVVLSELIVAVKRSLTSSIDEIRCFTDSQIVLSWLLKEPASWKVFVANRTSKILQAVSKENWFHVRSEDNPADLLSRGCAPTDLSNSKLWWNGPKELIKQHVDRKDSSLIISPNEDELVVIHQEKKHVVLISVKQQDNVLDELLENKGDLSTVLRIIAQMTRFANNLKIKEVKKRSTGPLTYSEINDAKLIMARNSQRKHFPNEIQHLKKQTPLPRSSTILSLAPVWDETLKLIKVGGRVNKADLPEPRKHQIILPYNDNFTRRLFEMEHLKLLHAGPQLMLHQIRYQWWPVNGKRLASSMYRNCVTCTKLDPRLQIQKMGNLPEHRVTQSKPFNTTCLDFAGPFKCKQNEGPRCTRTRDAYICVFVCSSTKAVHLEVVSAYTAEAFLACLKRFVARRGKVRNIFCDNGTNFTGANNILMKMMKDEKIMDKLNHEFDFIKFHFAPARSPHVGGIYEANVRSLKKHLNRVMGKACLNFEELQTLTTQIEACLNSRPLCILPSGPEEIKVLTPGHFLTGDALTSVPEPDYTNIAPNRLSKWCQIQQMLQSFWKIWSTEYINSMQQRYKWHKIIPNLKAGDIVVVQDDNSKPLHWPLGRVTKVFPDQEDVVRTVELNINRHLTRRSVHRLCKLPIDDDQDQEQEEITE